MNIRICHYCTSPTYFGQYDSFQFPGHKYGVDVEALPEDIYGLYEESRLSYSVSAYGASAMCSRKILMNIAVNKGAEKNKTFKFYVDYLRDNHYIPPNSEQWVEMIRKVGNDANHEIMVITQEQAKELIDFTSFLLKFIYEFPSKIPVKETQ